MVLKASMRLSPTLKRMSIDEFLNFIFLVRYKGSPINPPMGNPPSPDAAIDIPNLMVSLNSSSRSRQSVLKTLCLRRDGYRCVMSGAPDAWSHIQGRVSFTNGGLGTCETKCVHIIPFGIRDIDEDNAQEVRSRYIYPARMANPNHYT